MNSLSHHSNEINPINNLCKLNGRTQRICNNTVTEHPCDPD
jgi:hypothetical protein